MMLVMSLNEVYHGREVLQYGMVGITQADWLIKKKVFNVEFRLLGALFTAASQHKFCSPMSKLLKKRSAQAGTIINTFCSVCIS